LQNVENIRLYDENNTLYDCELNDLNAELISGTSQYLVTLNLKILHQYIDNEIDESLVLSENNISNFCTYDYLTEKYNVADLTKLELTNFENVDSDVDFETGESIEFYSKFIPKIKNSENTIEEITLKSGQVFISKVENFKVYTVRFYLTLSELILLQKYAKICFWIDTGFNLGAVLTYQGNTVNSEKPIDFTINDKVQLIDVYEVDINLYTNIIVYYPFENQTV